MTKKTILSTLLLVILTAITFNSCSSDDGGDSCGKIENIGVSSIDATMISFYFESGNNANSTKIEYGIAGFAKGTGAIMTTSNTYVTIDNLNPSTTYDFYFTGICSSTEEAKTVKMSSITTGPSNCTGTAFASFYQSSTSSVNIDLSYNDSSPSYYEIEYGTSGFNLGSGTRVNTSTQFSSYYITINNIQPNTTYDFYVRAVCNSSFPNDTSNFVKYTYTTIGSCPAPHNLSSYLVSGSCNVGNAVMALSWSYDYGEPASFTVSVVTQGGQPSTTSNAFTTSNNGINLGGIHCMWPAFYVRANCQNGESSSWSGPYYF